MNFGPIQTLIWLSIFVGGLTSGVPERVTSAATGANNGSLESLLLSMAIVAGVGLLKLPPF